MKKTILKPFILPLLIVVCTLFYYFGELVDWAAWDALRKEFFYGVHDVHRILFLAPIIYAGYQARIKGAIIVTIVAFIIFLPRAFFISPYPDPLLRMILFVIFAGVIGCLVGALRDQVIKSQHLESILASERDKLLIVAGEVADGIVIIGPDYKIRYMNSKMADSFGDGVGRTCYQHLRNLETPCQNECNIPGVVNNAEIGRWECSLSDGKTYEVVEAPYVDTDGTVCQVSIFKKIK